MATGVLGWVYEDLHIFVNKVGVTVSVYLAVRYPVYSFIRFDRYTSHRK